MKFPKKYNPYWFYFQYDVEMIESENGKWINVNDWFELYKKYNKLKKENKRQYEQIFKLENKLF